MPRVSVPQKDGELVVFDGVESTTYPVKAGEILVSDNHLAAVLSSVADSELKPEQPAKEA